MAEEQRVLILGMGSGDESSVILHLFPKVVEQLMQASEWFKRNPSEKYVEIILHGEKPDALIWSVSRNTLLSITSESLNPLQGITLH